jgi:hypothetical protein
MVDRRKQEVMGLQQRSKTVTGNPAHDKGRGSRYYEGIENTPLVFKGTVYFLYTMQPKTGSTSWKICE